MAVPFTKYTISSSQYKVIRHTKRQKIQFEETKGNAKSQKHCNKKEGCFDGLLNRLDTTEEGIIELEELSVETSKLRCREKKNKKNRMILNRMPKNLGTTTKGVAYM